MSIKKKAASFNPLNETSLTTTEESSIDVENENNFQTLVLEIDETSPKFVNKTD
jgi:hypothetical protein